MLKPRVRGEHGIEGDGFIGVVRTGIEMCMRVAVDDDLRPAIAGRLEQHRVEIDLRIDAGRNGLQRLRAPISPPSTVTALFNAMFCGLNGATFTPRAREPAKPRDQRALAGIGSRALDHQRAAR